MILSDRSRPAPEPRRDPGQAAEHPRPTATCGACGRPVADRKRPACIYCGAALPVTARVRLPADAGGTASARSAIPAEMLVLLEPRRDEAAARNRWLMRAVAVAVAAALIGLVVAATLRAR